MVIFSIPVSNHLIYSTIFLFALFSAPHFSLSLSNKPYFVRNLVLIGDAKFTNNSFSVQLTDPKNSSPSSGFVIQKKPIKILSSNSRPIRPISFSTDFTFSISPHNGDGLAFLLVSRKFMPKFSKQSFGVSKGSPFFAVEYDTFFDENLGDVNSKWGSIFDVMPGELVALIERINDSESDRVSCLIADATMSWALEVAEELGIKKAAFWSAAAALLALIFEIPRLVDDGILDSNGQPMKMQSIQLSPTMPFIKPTEFAWNWNGDDEVQRKSLFKFFIKIIKPTKLAERPATHQIGWSQERLLHIQTF